MSPSLPDPQLLQPYLVPTTERLCHNWDEGNYLLITLVDRAHNLIVIG